MPNKVVQFNLIGTVTLSQNKRSKNIKISVKPDKSVLVSFPFYVSAKEVAAFVQKNEDWILKQQQKFAIRKQIFGPETTIQTKFYDIHFFKGEENKAIRKEKSVSIWVKDFKHDDSLKYIENILIAVYRYEAKIILPERIRELAGLYGYKYNKITIRNNKRNWGSCSSKNNISLNLQMMKLPNHLIDYILLHELVHTVVKNHGAKFWEDLNKITDYKARELAKEVKKYSTYLI